MPLQINRANFSLSSEPITLFFQAGSSALLFRSQLKNLKEKFAYTQDFERWTTDNNIKDEDPVYFGFSNPESDCFQIKDVTFDQSSGFNYFRRKFIRHILIDELKKRGFKIQPYPLTWDLSAYQKTGKYNDQWETYRRFDLSIKDNRSEIIFNIGSDKTYISVSDVEIKNDHIKFIDDDSFIKSAKDKNIGEQHRIIATREIKAQTGIPHEVRKLSYSMLYNDLYQFYNEHLLAIDHPCFKVEAGGLKNVEPRDCFNVNLNQNKMVFGKNQTDINAVSGMREFGPYRKSPKAAENKFIFIYENRDDANKLYFHFKNGLKHFPGLWSYVGIPATLADLKLKYSNIDTLKDEFDSFLANDLKDDNYNNYFAIVIGPFNRQESDEEESNLYYYIKGKLLEKGIPSQFVNYKGLREGSFHYYLPNIAVAILAKLGGIPWKLMTKKQEELVIGFNQLKVGEKKYIGSAVFFTNEGSLGSVFGYPEVDSDTALIRHLKASIENYIESKNTPPARLVLHYYKPYSEKEYRSIEELIQNELRLNIPFAIVEINDSKTQTDICFDPDFRMGMPESGTYVKVGFNEYLLFNNTRYQKTPSRTVLEELPIKIKIHFADTGGFSHKDIISQIYEFSRLYWKGLKQRSQPATTIYAKLVAEFEAHLNMPLPNNNITNETPWFL